MLSSALFGSINLPTSTATWISYVQRAHKNLSSTQLKSQLIGLHFLSDADVIATAETWLDRQPSDFFFLVAC